MNIYKICVVLLNFKDSNFTPITEYGQLGIVAKYLVLGMDKHFIAKI